MSELKNRVDDWFRRFDEIFANLITAGDTPEARVIYRKKKNALDKEPITQSIHWNIRRKQRVETVMEVVTTRSTLMRRELNKEHLFPDIRSFNELFDSAKLWKHSPGSGPSITGTRRGYKFSKFCQMDRVNKDYTPALEVELNRELLGQINDSLVVPDELYFKIIIWDDTEAGVWIQHNQIIGSRALAVITTNSIPSPS